MVSEPKAAELLNVSVRELNRRMDGPRGVWRLVYDVFVREARATAKSAHASIVEVARAVQVVSYTTKR